MLTFMSTALAGMTFGITTVIVMTAALVLAVLLVVADWIVFKKAGQHGWATLIPFYRDYVGFKITWGNGWLFLIPVVLSALSEKEALAVICGILLFVIHALSAYKKAEAFGKGIGFAAGLFFLPSIFTLILAFGSAQYLGVPQDGTSYRQLKAKVQGHDARRKANMEYDDPNQ